MKQFSVGNFQEQKSLCPSSFPAIAFQNEKAFERTQEFRYNR